MRFRQSELKVWMQCSLQAHLNQVAPEAWQVGSKATFGSVIHASLDHYNKTGDVETAIRLFTEGWEDPRILSLPEITQWNKYTTYGGLRQRGLEILRAYHERMRWEQRVVVASEHRFLVPFGEHELTGTVDLVSVRQNHKGKQLLTVEDYKTVSKKPTVAELRLNVQFSTYMWALSQREFWFGNGNDYPPVNNAEWNYELLKDLPRRGMWVHLWDNAKELDAGERDEHDFGQLYRLCNEIERANEHQVFVPHPGDACTFCPHANGLCPQIPPTRDYWENHRIEEDANSWA